MMNRFCLFALFGVFGIFGCSSSSDSPPATDASFDGIYELLSVTQNDLTCDAEGAATTVNAKSFFVLTLAYGTSVASCGDLSNCRDLAAKLKASQPVGMDFVYQLTAKDGEALTGHAAWTGSSGSATCEGARLSDTRLYGTPKGAVTLEVRDTAAPHPQDSQGMCTTSDTQAAAQGKPCTSLLVYHANYKGTL